MTGRDFAVVRLPVNRDTIVVVEWISVPMDKDWLNVADIAGFMDVSAYVVTGVLRSGDLPAVKMGREWRVSRHDFERWINAQRGAPPR